MSADHDGDRESDPAAAPPRSGRTSLTDAVVAALAQVGSEPPPPLAPGAPHAPPPMAPQGGQTLPAGSSNGFRSGPGSFQDLVNRGSQPAAAPAPAAPHTAAAAPAPDAPAVHGPSSPETFPDTTMQSDPPPMIEPGERIMMRYFGLTDVGLVRDHNEDNFIVADLTANSRGIGKQPIEGAVGQRGVIFGVCDGMGGAAAGEVASQMAVDTIHEVMNGAAPLADRDAFAHRLVHAVEEAGHRIFSAAKMDRTRRGMGTTATLAGLLDNVLFVGQVGDSRAYVLRGDQFAQITKDQSLVNQLIEAGQLTEEEAEAFEHSNIILQALGTTEEVTVDLTFLELRKGDRLLLCSDGLSSLVHGDTIKQVVQTTPDMVEAGHKLVEMANNAGGHDNITVVLCDFDGEKLSGAIDARVAYQQYPLPPSDARRTSVPPRDTRMKEGGLKPGADVKRGDSVMAAVDVTPAVSLPAGRRGSGGGMLFVALLVLGGLLLLVAGGAFLFLGSGGTPEAEGEAFVEEPSPPPAPAATPIPVEETPLEIAEDPPPLEEVVEEESPPASGVIRLRTSITEGTLYVGSEARGPVHDGMELSLPPNAYTLSIRNDDALVVEETVTVADGDVLDIQLERPEIPELEAPPEPAPTTRRRRPRRRAAETAAESEPAPAPAAEEPPSRPARPSRPRPRPAPESTSEMDAPPDNPFK